MSGLFNLPPRSTRVGDSTITKKSNNSNIQVASAGIKIKGGGGLLERIATITALVKTKLGKYFSLYDVIRDEEILIDYIDKAIENGIIAIDTETTGLDVLECTIAGICIYTPGKKGAYIPINHVSYVTGIKVKDQLSPEFISTQLQRISDAEIDVDMFNAKFDTSIILHHLGITIKCTWDGYIGARLLNELEPENNLKSLHQKYVLKGKGDAFSFNSLFNGIPFTFIPIKIGYVYAARDPEITYELCEFQRPFLTPENPVCIEKNLVGVASIFHTIEMPLIQTVAKMEATGIAFDFEYSNKLSKKYNDKMIKLEDKFNNSVKMYEEEIKDYISRNTNSKISYPINPKSPTQLAILFYDIMNLKSMDKKSPRGTGVNAIEGNNDPICEALLEYKKVQKLISTYVDKLPSDVNKHTGRIHASFNQMGTDTGRFSSSNPNMQNIPSKNKDIRKLFIATEGYALLSSDYSSQEPRLAAHLCGDEKMIQAFIEGKDIYVAVASIAFDLPYEDCMEFKPDGSRSQEGADRRAAAKQVVLGVLYTKGVPAIAEELGISVKKAQKIYDTIMMNFPKLQQFMKDSEQMARDFGYVTTIWGRKRRLPDMQLPEYEFSYINGIPKGFDPLAFEQEYTLEVSEAEINDYWNRLEDCKYWKQKKGIVDLARENNIKIKDNTLLVQEATRQCVNSRVQGSAADQTKKAMLLVDNDKELLNYGFRLLLPVHDELIGEAPLEVLGAVAKRFEYLMVKASQDLTVPSKCDIEAFDRWYGNQIKINY